MSKTALICWVGGRDLDAAKGESDKLGPILSTLQARPHRQLHLLYNYDTEQVTAYRDWLAAQLDIDIHLYEADLRSPVHYRDIYEEASRLMKRLVKELTADEISVLISPGTPQMQSVWILMCKTTYAVSMLEASEEQGVGDVDVPFDIAADFIPSLLKESDATLRRLSGGDVATPAAFESIITKNPVMRAQILKAQKIAERDIPVLILGESGTGKELFARAIHRASDRAERNGGEPVTVNCGAIPRELVDSVLFGHVKGAFTGAVANKTGVFEEADGGTIFLDEFGELPPETQVRLLRVLQDGTFNKVGDPKDIKVDVRVIAATNRDLMTEMVEGRFREDLFYRVAVGIVNLPPLREREGDLMLLTDKLLEGINAEAVSKIPEYKDKKLSAKARKIINSHGWPGNVRELHACLTRASVWSGGDSITEREMRDALLIRPAKSGDILGLNLDNTFDIQDLIKELKRHYIQKALAESGGNKTKAAERLGLKSYQVLNSWMEDVGLKD
jgi:transcriptional regulator with PAS, ATPase and Fis domain